MIRNIQLNHGGKYVCIIDTDVEGLSASAILVVKGKGADRSGGLARGGVEESAPAQKEGESFDGRRCDGSPGLPVNTGRVGFMSAPVCILPAWRRFAAITHAHTHTGGRLLADEAPLIFAQRVGSSLVSYIGAGALNRL